MKKQLSSFALLLGVFAAAPALAATYAPAPAAPSSAAATPDMIAAGLGDYDFDRDGDRSSADYRIEYQWGASLLPMVDPAADLDTMFKIHPVAGLEGNGNGMTYFSGGLNLDVPVVSHLMFTWGEAAGWYGHGDDRQTLGDPFEVRSQLELGWVFDNNMRLSAYVSELSNLGLGDRDPGAEVLGAYLRVPVSWLARK